MFYDQPSNYIDFIIPPLQDLLEVKEIAKAADFEIDRLSASLKRGIENRFPTTCDEAGCARWEKILGLSTPMNSSLKARRDAIRAKIITKPPINRNTLQSIVEAYMGLPVQIELDGFHVRIRYRGESRIADLKPLYATLWETLPANLLVDISYLYVTWQQAQQEYPTWAGFQAKSWEQIRKGGSI